MMTRKPNIHSTSVIFFPLKFLLKKFSFKKKFQKSNPLFLVLTKEHINDEIKLHNSTIQHRKTNKIDSDLIKLRIGKIDQVYESILSKFTSKRKQNNFLKFHLSRYQFTSLPSYDFRVRHYIFKKYQLNPRYKSYYVLGKGVDAIGSQKRNLDEVELEKLHTINVQGNFVSYLQGKVEGNSD